MTFTAPDLSDKVLKVAAFDMSFIQWSDNESSTRDRFGEFSSTLATLTYQTTWSSKAAFINALLHEITHAIFWTYNIDAEKDDEERITGFFSTAWTQIYRDNPWLLKLIAKMLK